MGTDKVQIVKITLGQTINQFLSTLLVKMKEVHPHSIKDEIGFEILLAIFSGDWVEQ